MTIRALILGCALSVTWASLQTDGRSKEAFNPPKTHVALLPVINLSGEKVAEERAKQAESGKEELTKLFRDRGFPLIDESRIANVIASQKLDLTDVEQHRKAVLFGIGRAVKANLLCFVVIEDVDQRMNHTLLGASREGKVKLRIWLLDVANEGAILNALAREGNSKGGVFAGLEKGSARIRLAVANGIRDALKDFLKPYPVLKAATRK